METITLNGHKFGKGKKSVTASLFKSGGTVDGYYTTFRSKKHGTYGVRFFSTNGDALFAVVTDGNSCTGRTAGKLDNGDTFWMFAISNAQAVKYWAKEELTQSDLQMVLQMEVNAFNGSWD